MSAPRLNRALQLEELVRHPDGKGGFGNSWQGLGTLWAEVLPVSGRDVAADQVLASKAGLKITVRAAAPGAASRPRADQRFREGLRVYHILAVTERDAEGLYLLCYAEEEVAA